METGNVCSSCKCRSSKKWHSVPATDGSPIGSVLCNNCSSSASDLAQLKLGEAVDNLAESIASEDIKYEVEFYSHQEEESQSNPAIDLDFIPDANEGTGPGSTSAAGIKRSGKRKKGKRGGFRGGQGQNTGPAGKGKSRRSIFKQCVSIVETFNNLT